MSVSSFGRRNKIRRHGQELQNVYARGTKNPVGTETVVVQDSLEL